MRKLAFALLAVSILSCTGRDGSNTTIEANEKNSLATQKISQELLWEILMKIPEKHTPYGFLTTQEQRQKEKEYAYIDDGDKNYLKFEDLSEGVSAILICFPIEDSEKLIVIYNQTEYIFGITHTVADYTYEYELATGKLTPIERPIDPYTFDEFYDESIFTPKQLRAVKYAFNNKACHNLYYSEYGEKNCIEISLNIDACFGKECFDTEEEYNECRDIAWEYYNQGDEWVKRYWNGKRFVKNTENKKSPTTKKPSVKTKAIENSSSKQEKTNEIINKELLWKIFMKIPKETTTEYYRTKLQNQKARAARYKIPPYENHKNYISLADVEEGVILACYPTEDGKKLISIFYQEYGIDGANTVEANLTYEYELATGILTPIECPIDPFTLDEFIDKSILTPKQLKLLENSLERGNKLIFNHYENRDVIEIYLLPDNSNGELRGEFDKCRNLLDDYRFEHGYVVKRYWNGKRFVKNLVND